MTAWPFGVYDEYLLQMAVDADYVAGVGRLTATARDPIMARRGFW